VVKTAVGHSEDVDPADAGAEAVAQALAALGGHAPRAALVFTGIDVDPKAALDAVSARLPGVLLVGGTTAAEVSRPLGAVECSVLVVLFAGEGLDVGAGCGHQGNAEARAAEAVAQARASLTSAPELCICIASSPHLELSEVQRALTQHLGPEVLVVGGGSAGEMGKGPLLSKEFFGAEVVESAVVLLLFGKGVRVAHSLELGWSAVSAPFTATRVEGSRVLRELDGRPAGRVFAETLGTAGGPGVTYVHHPLAVTVPDGALLRTAFASGPLPESFLLAGDVAEGATLRFCEFERDTLLASSPEAAARALGRWSGPPPELALVFECLTRWTVLGTSVRDAVASLQAALPSETPLAGVYVGGEFAPFQAGQRGYVHNCSIVVLLVGGA
jgi:hypothetical protein